jgi:enoyl-CoA hydratase/carnithine racemase
MKHLRIKRDGPITIVSIDRPESMNALSIEVLKEFCSLQEYFRQDLETRVVIFTGEGENFSAGADLKEKAQLSTKLESWRNNFGKPAIKSILEIDQITIAAVNGYCLGGAACIASACDFRIASKKSLLGYPEINLGINLNWLGLPLAVRLIGPAKAKKMVIGGENEKAETLLSWGFYDEICDADELMDKAISMAKLYASKSPIAAQMIKRSVNNLVYKNDESIMHMDYDQTLLTHETQDRKEAVTAFFEKRNPEFKGD